MEPTEEGGLAWPVLERIDAAELRVEIRHVIGLRAQFIVYLIVDCHRLFVDIFHSDAAALFKRHRPVAAKRAARVYAHRQ